MPPRSKVLTLPKDVREQLEGRMLAAGFADYAALSDWLESQGHSISRSSLQRHGSKFERRLASVKRATEQAKALVMETDDSAGDLNQALLSLLQTEMFDVMVELDESGEMTPKAISALSRAVAELGRASVQQKKFAAEVKRKALAEAAAATEATAKEVGLSDEHWSLIRAKFLGIDDA